MKWKDFRSWMNEYFNDDDDIRITVTNEYRELNDDIKDIYPVITIITQEEAKHAKIDLVVRDGLGSPLFRTSLLDMSFVDREHKGQSYSDPYGWFGTPSVYNADYKDAPNSGFEFYTKQTKQWS